MSDGRHHVRRTHRDAAEPDGDQRGRVEHLRLSGRGRVTAEQRLVDELAQGGVPVGPQVILQGRQLSLP